MRGLWLAAALFLMGCAPQFGAALGPDIRSPVMGDDTLMTRDGTVLPLRRGSRKGRPGL